MMIVGSRSVTFKDRQCMPYTEATILETLRVGNIVPSASPHAVDKDVIIDGKVRTLWAFRAHQ